MNILAVDQARKGAWAVFSYEKKELIDCGAFEFPAEKFTYSKAIVQIEDLIRSVIEKYDVSAVFLEDIQLRANVQAFKKLAWLQGVLVNLLERNEYLYDVIAPSKWQSFCMARSRNTSEIKAKVKQAGLDGRHATKMLSIQFVKDHFGIETEDDNLADAVCIGWYVVNEIELVVQQKPKPKTGERKKGQRKVIDDGKKG